MTPIRCTTTNVIYKYIKENNEHLKVGNIVLTKALSKDTRWVECVVAGPDSVINEKDKLLLSHRAVSYKFNIEGHEYMNTADASILCYERKGSYNATCGTILYKWIDEEEEEITPGGIVLMKKNATKELEPRKALVFAAGPTSGVQKGDHVLLAYKTDAYTFEIDGHKLHNAGKEEVICYWRKD